MSEQFPAPVRQRNLSPPENDGYLDLVFIFDEPVDMVQFYLDIVFAGFGSNLDFLYLERTLFFLGFLLFFGLLVFIATIVHDFTDRRIRVRRNLHQIETIVTGDSKGLVRGNNADLIAVRVDDSDFFCSDVFVYVGSVRFVVSVWSSWKSYTPTSLFGMCV